MIITYYTGGEPEHKVAICINHIAYLKPQGNGSMTWIHLTNGEKFLVDEAFDKVKGNLRDALEASHEA